MTELLSSLETEYGFAALDRRGERVPAGRLARRFAQAVADQGPWLSAAEGGWFLGNSARLYWDAGAHPEYATPECAGHPRLLVAHVRAGHRILSRIGAALRGHAEVAEVRIWRGNVDAVTGSSWGSHENHLVRNSAERLLPDLVPHLVSRVVYGGAGGLGPGREPQFSLSPRLALFTQTMSHDTMGERGIVNLRREDHAREHRRLHLICRDSLLSATGELLTTGLTRLVVALADRGLRPADGLVLDDPIGALRCFAGDVSVSERVPTSVGPLRALDIQRRYLEAVDAQRPQLPDWTDELLALAANVLDALERDPEELCGVLDWPTRLAVFRRSGLGGVDLVLLDQLLSELDSPLDALLGGDGRPSTGVTDAEVEAAMCSAPANTRARIRARVIRRYSGNPEVSCGWAGIFSPDRFLELADPFETEERWHARER